MPSSMSPGRSLGIIRYLAPGTSPNAFSSAWATWPCSSSRILLTSVVSADNRLALCSIIFNRAFSADKLAITCLLCHLHLLTSYQLDKISQPEVRNLAGHGNHTPIIPSLGHIHVVGWVELADEYTLVVMGQPADKIERAHHRIQSHLTRYVWTIRKGFLKPRLAHLLFQKVDVEVGVQAHPGVPQGFRPSTNLVVDGHAVNLALLHVPAELEIVGVDGRTLLGLFVEPVRTVQLLVGNPGDHPAASIQADVLVEAGSEGADWPIRTEGVLQLRQAVHPDDIVFYGE